MATTASESGTVGNERIPPANEALLRFIDSYTFNGFGVPRPAGRNDFVRYVKDVCKALVGDIREGKPDSHSAWHCIWQCMAVQSLRPGLFHFTAQFKFNLSLILGGKLK